MQSFGRSFTLLSSIDSTNNYAMQKVHARLARHGDAWFAMEQTKGKGQRNKNWQSNAGENIILSIVTEPGFLAPARSFLLNAAVALGTYDFFKKYGGPETRIKWPNDIYWGDRKAGGILIESVIRAEQWLYAVLGIGLNINQTGFGNNLQATSLRLITGRHFEVTTLARELCLFLEERYDMLKAGHEALILQDYCRVMYRLNEQVQFKKPGLIFEGVVKGVTPAGLLIVETNNKEQQWAWGEVEWVIG
jgi:BirA family biotin operon repressor/biotin-[acetyl-CoA-carboxylase] ligase